MTSDEMRRLTDGFGITFETHALGDGVRRYTFLANDGHRLYTARGKADAESFLMGFAEGQSYQRDNRIEENPLGEFSGLQRKVAKKILARARRDLGYDLRGFSPVDLLLDNMSDLRSVEEARALLREVDD